MLSVARLVPWCVETIQFVLQGLMCQGPCHARHTDAALAVCEGMPEGDKFGLTVAGGGDSCHILLSVEWSDKMQNMSELAVRGSLSWAK